MCIWHVRQCLRSRSGVKQRFLQELFLACRRCRCGIIGNWHAVIGSRNFLTGTRGTEQTCTSSAPASQAAETSARPAVRSRATAVAAGAFGIGTRSPCVLLAGRAARPRGRRLSGRRTGPSADVVLSELSAAAECGFSCTATSTRRGRAMLRSPE
eukprot:365711-Chlamydomonas_euryale.AAC.19